MREWEQLGRSEPDPMVVLYRAVSLSTKLLGSPSDDHIYNTVRDEFARSQRYRMMILLLAESGAKLKIAATSVRTDTLLAVERALGLPFGDYRMDPAKSDTLRRVAWDLQTLRVPTTSLMYDLFPSSQAYTISRIMRTEQRTSILTPLTRFAITVGILGVSSTDPSEDMVSLVRSLGTNISAALELADERAERERLKRQALEHERQLEEAVAARSAELRQANAQLEREIADRTEAEEALSDSVRLWQATFDAIADPVCLLDVEGRVQRCNSAMVQLSGMPFDEVLGGSCCEMLHGDSKPVEGCPLVRMRQTRHSETAMLPIGKKWFAIGVDPWLDDSGALLGAVHIMSDVTEQVRLETRLREAQKLEAVGRLARGVAHHFRNFLTPIIGFSDLILNDLKADDPLRQDLLRIRRSGQRAAALTTEMLVFSREQDVHPVQTDLNALILEVLEEVRDVPTEGVSLLTQLEPDLERVTIDRVSMQRVLVTLAKNACDAMSAGGTLTISTANVTLDGEEPGLDPEVRPGPFVCLSVADTGAGMDQEVLQHIFEPFFTTKDVGEGVGLGLAMLYSIVRQHGGWTAVQSDLGHGSTFAVYLPALPEDQQDG